MKTRDELRRQGEAMHARLFGPEEAKRGCASRDASGFGDLVSEVVFGSVWSRPGLGLVDRMVCTLAALCAVRALPQLERYVDAALNLNMPPGSILEPFIQIGIYAGFPASDGAIDVAQAVFEKRGVGVPRSSPENATLDALLHRGQGILEAMHRERGSLGYASPDNAFTSALYPLAIQYGYGVIWSRPGLDLRQRSLCAIAGFTALRMEDQAKKFAQSALNVGLEKPEIVEAVVQTGPYSGFAPALNALRWLSEVL